MKIKEHLADVATEVNAGGYKEGFLEGFDRARDIALKVVNSYQSAGDYTNWNDQIEADLEKLGEEEI